jgi:gluconokinase
MKEFPVRSPSEKVGGLFYFGRMLDKIRLHARAELPEDYQPNLGRGFDAKLCRFLHLDYGDVTKRVNDGATDAEILEWALMAGRRPTDDEIKMWNEFMRKFGWRDEAAEILARRKREAGMENRAEIETMFQFIDADEGREVSPPPVAGSGSR